MNSARMKSGVLLAFSALHKLMARLMLALSWSSAGSG
jgi:hypothetical protein